MHLENENMGLPYLFFINIYTHIAFTLVSKVEFLLHIYSFDTDVVYVC